MRIGPREVRWLDDAALALLRRGDEEDVATEVLRGFSSSPRARNFDPSQALELFLALATYRLQVPQVQQGGFVPQEYEPPAGGEVLADSVPHEVYDLVRGAGRRPISEFGTLFAEAITISLEFCWWPWKPDASNVIYGEPADRSYEAVRDDLYGSVEDTSSVAGLTRSLHSRLSEAVSRLPAGLLTPTAEIVRAVYSADFDAVSGLLAVPDTAPLHLQAKI